MDSITTTSGPVMIPALTTRATSATSAACLRAAVAPSAVLVGRGGAGALAPVAARPRPEHRHAVSPTAVNPVAVYPTAKPDAQLRASVRWSDDL